MVLLSILILGSDGRLVRDEIDLHIGGLFPISGTGGWQGGQACLPAAKMALDDVNNAPNLLTGYRLLLHWNDSEVSGINYVYLTGFLMKLIRVKKKLQCNPGLASSILYDLIYKPPTKLLVMGGCSPVSSTIAETAKMYNLVVIGYGSSSPALSDRSRFTTFFRTHPPATVHNPTRIEIFKMFGWTRIAIILEAEEVFQSVSLIPKSLLSFAK
jgi:gamma-aminobutyric acid type B receptor